MFTAEQESAVYTEGCELLVSAAAGSGKTAVLVERILHWVIDKPVDIDRLLVVTFTDAAANEMRQRLSQELYERQQRAPDNEHLQRQTLLLQRAQISTIHKFCAMVIRRYFHLTDLDPGFKIADETEVRLLKSEVLDELFEERYAGDDDFFRLVDTYGGGRTKDAGLHELVLELNEFVSGFPWPEDWLAQAAELTDPGAALETTPWAAVLREELLRKLGGVAATIDYALGLAASGAEKYTEALADDRQLVEGLLRWLDAETGGMGWLEAFREGLFAAAHTQLKRYSAKDEFDPEVKQRVQDIRDKEIKPALKELRKLFIKPTDEAMRDIAALYPVQKALCELTLEFRRRYSDAKRRRNIADFNDLEQITLQILRPVPLGGGLADAAPTDAAREQREKFDQVMIDEYQDSNLVQELILSAVADGNRFLVGDMKQSIYKFRGARPGIFMEKYKSYQPAPVPAAPFTSGSCGARIDLSKNFRSRPCVIDAVNMFFYQLMTADGEVTYDENAALYCGADYPSPPADEGLHVSQSTELYLVDGHSEDTPVETVEPDDADLSRTEMEAAVVAERINALVRGPSPLAVYDRNTAAYRRAAFRDIVILLRSVRGGVAETFLDVLKKNGIPAFADTSTGYFESVEVMTVLSFLQVTDNPRQDIPLLAVLRSPVYGLTDEQLLAVRGVGKTPVFYDCVKAYASGGTSSSAEPSEATEIVQKLEHFLTDLEKFRRDAGYLPISALINEIYTTTDYFNYVGAMPGGAVRQANLRLLREKAVQYEETSYQGLFHFVHYIQKVKRESDEGGAKTLSENADLVRLMTIHKSKGLEFPIVFVSLLGRGFSRADEKKTVVMHETLGLGAAHIDLERRVRSNTLPRIAIIKKMRQEALNEELRVLYVAMTRAKEKLILTGSVANLAKADEKWSRYAQLPARALPAHVVYDANHYLDWIVPAVYHMNRPAADVEVRYKTLADVLDLCVTEAERDADRRSALRVLEPVADAEAGTVFSWVYPRRPVAGLPAKLSISEIKRLHSRGVDADAVAYAPESPVPEPQAKESSPIYTPPRFLRESGRLTPAAKGAVMHTVLEHMDLGRVNDEADLRALVARLTAKAVLSAHEAEAVDYAAIIQFNQSECMRRIIAAYPGVHRETPFVMGLTPFQIYKNPEYRDLEANILVHGIIDCWFEEDDGLVLIDYKTGYVPSVEAVLDTYSLQMSVYKLALERATGKTVKACLLYLFGLGQGVEARLTEL